jgi:hypothetical protein
MTRTRIGSAVVAGILLMGTMGCGAAVPGWRVLQTAPIETNLSFDLFGNHKTYKTVTAETGQDANGQPQTTVRALDGENTLTMIVAGSGVGEHAVKSVTIKDQRLGGKEYSFTNSDSRLSGTVNFTEFDPASGKVAGTFTAAYKGFPPVSVQNGTVTAMAVQPGQPAPGMATAGLP